MLDEKTRQAIALKRFSIISPILSGTVKNNREYFQELSKTPVDMPHFGTKLYHHKTLESWLYDYHRYGLDGLTPGFRSDKGKSRKISIELGDKIKAYRIKNPKMPTTILYDKLVSEGIIDPLTLSRSTLYRYVADMVLPNGVEGIGESLRFSYQYPGEMWQGDVMYGPYIQVGKKKQQTYLHAFIDDATRMIVHSQFFYEQNFETLRISLKEAMLKNGIPRLIYTDNGKIYRSQQLEYICASMGSTLLHSQPYVPKGRGKIERYFHTVRMRFLSQLNPKDLHSLESLNEAYQRWLDSDYQKKEHSALGGKSPHQSFINHIDRVKLVTDRRQLDECFLLRVSRKVCHDATLQINNTLFETDASFAGKRLEIRYEPEWLQDPTKSLKLYENGKCIGEARQIRFFDNAYVKRRFPGNRKKANAPIKDITSSQLEEKSFNPKNTISFASLAKGGMENV